MKKAIFLDRDGVLNQALIKNGKPYPPTDVSEVIIPDGVQTALNTLKSAGFLLIGATNQPDVARGSIKKITVEAINNYLLNNLKLDDIRVCYHDDQDRCACRKPAPGLILSAALDYEINLKKSYMIGDRWKDIEAGKNAGCKTIWLNYNYKEQAPSSPDLMTSSLMDAAQWIISRDV